MKKFLSRFNELKKVIKEKINKSFTRLIAIYKRWYGYILINVNIQE
jgi:hypothetical protein